MMHRLMHFLCFKLTKPMWSGYVCFHEHFFSFFIARGKRQIFLKLETSCVIFMQIV